MFTGDRLDEALATLGAVLSGRGQSAGILVVGGSSLLLLGVVSRPTADLDVVALPAGDRYVKAETLPAALVEAAGDVAEALELAPGWLNNGPSALMDFGLPVGFEDRVEIRRYDSLEVHLPGRFDLICFKLYAAVDQGPASKHFADLQTLAPTGDELRRAAQWCQTHDPSPGFAGQLGGALTQLGAVQGADDDDG